MFLYKQKGNKDFKYVKEGLKFIHEILAPYNFEVIILADRGFKSIDLFEFIYKTLGFKYCIRCTKDLGIIIPDKPNIKKLEDIDPLKRRTKHFSNIKLTAKNYECNVAVCRAEGSHDTWFIANDLEKSLAIREYKKRFDIEEMFKDFKAGGFHLEDT